MKKALLMIALVSGVNVMGAAGHSKEEIEARRRQKVSEWLNEQTTLLGLYKKALANMDAGEGEELQAAEAEWLRTHKEAAKEAKDNSLWSRIAKKDAESGQLTPEELKMYQDIDANRNYLLKRGWLFR